MVTDDETPRTLGGVTLEQFAGVTAATAESIPLDRVLAQEHLAVDVWKAAAAAWREAIADSPSLQIELVRLRRIAEDCLHRRIDPLDGDPASWVGLLGELGAADRPADILAALGITASDVSRLGRRWRQRARDDGALEKKLVELAATATAPTSVTAGALELRPFPWSPKRAAERSAVTPVVGTSGADPVAPGLSHAVIRQRASFQIAVTRAAPPVVGAPEQTEEIDGRGLVEALVRPPLPFVPGPPAPPRSWTGTNDTTTELEHGETLMADGAAIRETLTSGAIPFANREDSARASIAGRVERFAAIQAATLDASDLEATLRTFGLSKETWELERRALAAELASVPALHALYERAWRDATNR